MGNEIGGGYRVLLTGDGRDVLDSVEEFLEKHEGFEVSVAETVGEAVQAVGEGNVDCVVCGDGVGGTTGVEFLRAVRSEGDVPFVAFLGDVSSEEEKEAIEAGATDVVRTTLGGFIAGIEDPGRDRLSPEGQRDRPVRRARKPGP